MISILKFRVLHQYFRPDDWVEALPSERRLQFICSYVILLLRISTILFVFSSFYVLLFHVFFGHFLNMVVVGVYFEFSVLCMQYNVT